MKVKEKKIKGVYEIQLKPIRDERGFFMRTFDNNIFKKLGLEWNWVQENHSRSIKKGILRGLHFQFAPFTETKLVRVIKGKIFDVFLDLREGSDTFGQWDSVILSEDTFNCIYIPKGFAHGFCTLTDLCEVVYKVGNYYSPEKEGGIIWNDKELNIEWPTEKPILSDKDINNISFREFVEKHNSLNIT